MKLVDALDKEFAEMDGRDSFPFDERRLGIIIRIQVSPLRPLVRRHPLIFFKFPGYPSSSDIERQRRLAVLKVDCFGIPEFRRRTWAELEADGRGTRARSMQVGGVGFESGNYIVAEVCADRFRRRTSRSRGVP